MLIFLYFIEILNDSKVLWEELVSCDVIVFSVIFFYTSENTMSIMTLTYKKDFMSLG